MKKLIKWKVCPAPTGRYRSFSERGWPSAYYNDENESIAAHIECQDEYIPKDVKTGNHKPLTVKIAFHQLTEEQRKKHGSFMRRKVSQTFSTLKEAKKWTENYIKEHYKEIAPKPNRDPNSYELLYMGNSEFLCSYCSCNFRIVNVKEKDMCLNYCPNCGKKNPKEQIIAF